MAALTTVPPYSYDTGGVSVQPPARSMRAGLVVFTQHPTGAGATFVVVMNSETVATHLAAADACQSWTANKRTKADWWADLTVR